MTIPPKLPPSSDYYQNIKKNKENIQKSQFRPAKIIGLPESSSKAEKKPLKRSIEGTAGISNKQKQKIEEFVASYLHPYIIGEKEKRENVAMMVKLLQALDPENSLSKTVKHQIENYAFAVYLKEAAKGLYIHENLVRTDKEFEKALKKLPARPPVPSLELIEEKSSRFKVLIQALKEAIPIDFPGHSLRNLSEAAANALEVVNQEKMAQKIQGERKWHIPEVSETKKPDLEGKMQRLESAILKHYDKSYLFGPEMQFIFKNHAAMDFIPPEQNTKDPYVKIFYNHLYDMADKDWDTIVKMNPEAQQHLQDAFQMFATIVNDAIKSPLFPQREHREVTAFVVMALKSIIRKQGT